MKLIEAHHLSKKFGSFTAVNAADLSLAAGERLALIGNNGAGKTTLMKMLVGLMIPDAGTARIAGHDITTMPLLAKQQLGYMSDDPTAYDYLSGEEFLILTGRLRGMSETAINHRLAELSKLFPIHSILSQPMSRYSRGNKQKVAFMAALFAKPKVLIIDEPIVGLDSASIDIMGQTLVEYTSEGNAAMFVTHIVDFAEKYATHAAVMVDGALEPPVAITHTTNLAKLIKTP